MCVCVGGGGGGRAALLKKFLGLEEILSAGGYACSPSVSANFSS